MLNGAHFHLMINHLPIAAFLFAAICMLIATFRKNDDHKRLTLMMVLVAAFLTLPAFFTGGGAAEVVKDMPEINPNLIGEHAQTATWALMLAILNGVLAACLLWIPGMSDKRFHRGMLCMVLITILTATVFARVGYLGGQIHHPEIMDKASGVTPP